MNRAYQDSNTNGSSSFQRDIIGLKESQVLIHQELRMIISKFVTQN